VKQPYWMVIGIAMLLDREEFGGETYHFVDKTPVELADLILTIRSSTSFTTY